MQKSNQITKKEHYVPQCYLRNFAIDGNDKKINVFDKKLTTIRINQNILDNASERYFYDIDLDKILDELPDEKRTQILNQLGDKYEIYKNQKSQYIEHLFSNVIEGEYSKILHNIIEKADNANTNQWYLHNCYSMNEEEKIIMAICIAIQFLRTKKQRITLEQGITKTYEALLRKIYNIEYGDKDGFLLPGDIDVHIGKEAMKYEHAKFMLDYKRVANITEVLLSHIWVVIINKTKIPFWTSDAPVALNPTGNGLRSGKGLGSKGIEIIMPLSNHYALGLYDRETFEGIFSRIDEKKDRLYISIDNEILICEYNILQLEECYRCVYSSDDDFSLAEQYCKSNPWVKEDQEYIKVD